MRAKAISLLFRMRYKRKSRSNSAMKSFVFVRYIADQFSLFVMIAHSLMLAIALAGFGSAIVCSGVFVRAEFFLVLASAFLRWQLSIAVRLRVQHLGRSLGLYLLSLEVP